MCILSRCIQWEREGGVSYLDVEPPRNFLKYMMHVYTHSAKATMQEAPLTSGTGTEFCVQRVMLRQLSLFLAV